MHTVIHINSTPGDVWERVKPFGKMQGDKRMEIDELSLRRAWQQSMRPKQSPLKPESFPGIRMRSEVEQALLLTICEPCDRNKKGRCSLCRSCGGGIPVADWVKLSTHHCPLKKW